MKSLIRELLKEITKEENDNSKTEGVGKLDEAVHSFFEKKEGLKDILNEEIESALKQAVSNVGKGYLFKEETE